MHYFLDYDDQWADISITGNDYVELISLCFRYAAYFSLTFTSEEQNARFEQLIEPTQCKILDGGIYRRKYRCFYRCSEDAQAFLLSHVNDLFEWIDFDNYNNPEDLIFYRDNGTIFFWSETHEGICALCNYTQEDVSSISSKRGWQYHNPQNRSIFGLPKDLCNYVETNVL